MGTYTHQTKKCPHCGKMYSHRIIRGPYPEEKKAEFGPLFVQCPSCQKYFRDSDRYELAVMDPPKGYLTHFHISTLIFCAILAVIALIILIKQTEAAASPVGAILLMLALIGGLLLADHMRYKRNVETVGREKRASVSRLRNDPTYALMLKAAGIQVPDEYLTGQDSSEERKPQSN